MAGKEIERHDGAFLIGMPGLKPEQRRALLARMAGEAESERRTIAEGAAKLGLRPHPTLDGIWIEGKPQAGLPERFFTLDREGNDISFKDHEITFPISNVAELGAALQSAYALYSRAENEVAQDRYGARGFVDFIVRAGRERRKKGPKTK
jgi:hypothetical protein